jgi:hypothetical protein
MTIYATNTFLIQPGHADELIGTLHAVRPETLRTRAIWQTCLRHRDSLRARRPPMLQLANRVLGEPRIRLASSIAEGWE